ncbi:hypothetical protein PVK06_018536 [Gossypium arboreum]|uniref:Uncharacterized protein n=1 Tax=Gossypium arboreum TaxID=29729 RepID=A0ABR0PHD3_GOSAR|nr:hypothetical protein PVK06_018536 [Gossypium arboreum]
MEFCINKSKDESGGSINVKHFVPNSDSEVGVSSHQFLLVSVVAYLLSLFSTLAPPLLVFLLVLWQPRCLFFVLHNVMTSVGGVHAIGSIAVTSRHDANALSLFLLAWRLLESLLGFWA